MGSLDATFTALGDSTRRAILARLAGGETALSEIAKPFDMTQTAVSKHVRVLREAGLVEVTKRGRTRYCRLSTAPMQEAIDWLKTYQVFWEERLDALSRFVEGDR